jgi:16S rRNA processing protein RimM
LHAGRVGRPHGLDGSFYVIDPNAALLALGVQVRVGERDLEISRRAGTDRRPIVRLGGVEDRSSAEALRGEELWVTRSEAPELEPGEWWVEELEGCAVHDSGRPVGTVRRVIALPSCDVLEVARGEGGELLVPLVSDAVREVDVERGEVDVDLAFLGER